MPDSLTITPESRILSYSHCLPRMLVLACGLLAVLIMLVAPAIGKLLICLLIGTALLAGILRYPHSTIVIMLALAPFYDLVRTLFVPDIALVGAWQDIVVIALGTVGVRNVFRKDFQWRLSGLDIAVCVYIGAYACSAFLSPTLGVWFYGFRWCTLYAFLYLVLKTYRFTEGQVRRMLIATTSGLVASVVTGYVLLSSLGERPYAAIWTAMGFSGYFRNGSFRWPATFPSPITASICYALLLILGLAHLLDGKYRWLYVGIAAVGMAACIATFSRSGWVVGLIGVSATAWAAKKQLRKYRIIVYSLITFTIVGAIGLAMVKPELLHIVSVKDSLDGFRLQTFSTVIYDAFRYPFGVGVGTAGAVAAVAAQFGGLQVRVDPVVGDSFLLQVLRDTGWVGFVAFFSVCVWLVGTALRGFRTTSNQVGRILTLASFGFSVGLLVNLMNATDVWPIRLYFWLFGALSVAIVEGRFDSSEARKQQL